MTRKTTPLTPASSIDIHTTIRLINKNDSIAQGVPEAPWNNPPRTPPKTKEE